MLYALFMLVSVHGWTSAHMGQECQGHQCQDGLSGNTMLQKRHEKVQSPFDAVEDGIDASIGKSIDLGTDASTDLGSYGSTHTDADDSTDVSPGDNGHASLADTGTTGTNVGIDPNMLIDGLIAKWGQSHADPNKFVDDLIADPMMPMLIGSVDADELIDSLIAKFSPAFAEFVPKSSPALRRCLSHFPKLSNSVRAVVGDTDEFDAGDVSKLMGQIKDAGTEMTQYTDCAGLMQKLPPFLQMVMKVDFSDLMQKLLPFLPMYKKAMLKHMPKIREFILDMATGADMGGSVSNHDGECEAEGMFNSSSGLQSTPFEPTSSTSGCEFMFLELEAPIPAEDSMSITAKQCRGRCQKGNTGRSMFGVSYTQTPEDDQYSNSLKFKCCCGDSLKRSESYKKLDVHPFFVLFEKEKIMAVFNCFANE
jgi:hypothetical protein